MNDGATSLRERRMLQTAERLTSASRRLTAERGLSGFTIEELCEEVGISRRTFFNYFPSKEDAVIGANQDDEAQLFAEDFLALGSRGWPAVLDDLVELAVMHFDGAGIDAASHAQLHAAIEREPRLLVRFMGVSRERERQVVELVAEREGVPADDPRAAAVVTILTALLRTTGEKLFDPANTTSFADHLSVSVEAIRAVMTAPTPLRKA